MKFNGNCECRLCGLRGISKNVRIRSVFSYFGDDRPILLENYERYIRARPDPERAGKFLFGSNQLDWHKEGAPLLSLAETLIEYLKTPGATPDDLKILLCVHDWVQDEGTETV